MEGVVREQPGYLTHHNLHSAVYPNKQLVIESSNQSLHMQLAEESLTEFIVKT